MVRVTPGRCIREVTPCHIKGIGDSRAAGDRTNCADGIWTPFIDRR
jgi:hypothetical protein